jgi:hypothetical protein
MGLEFKGDPSKMDGPIGQLFKSMGGKTPEDGTPAGEQPKAGEGMKKGGKVSSASSRGDGCCVKGKTKGRMV